MFDEDEKTPTRLASDHELVVRHEHLIRRTKRHMWAAILAAGTSLGGAGSILLQHAEARGAQEQTIANLKENVDRLERLRKEETDRLERYISELRAEIANLRKQSLSDPMTPGLSIVSR